MSNGVEVIHIYATNIHSSPTQHSNTNTYIRLRHTSTTKKERKKELETFWKQGIFSGIHYFEMSDRLSTNEKRKVDEEVKEEVQKRLKWDDQESSDDEQSDSSGDDKPSEIELYWRLSQRQGPHLMQNPSSLIQHRYDILPANIKEWAEASLARAEGTKPLDSLYALAGALQFLLLVHGENTPFENFVVQSISDNTDIPSQPGTKGIIKMTRVALEKRNVFDRWHDLNALAKKWGLPMIEVCDPLPRTVNFQDLVNVLLWGFEIIYVD